MVGQGKIPISINFIYVLEICPWNSYSNSTHYTSILTDFDNRISFRCAFMQITNAMRVSQTNRGKMWSTNIIRGSLKRQLCLLWPQTFLSYRISLATCPPSVVPGFVLFRSWKIIRAHSMGCLGSSIAQSVCEQPFSPLRNRYMVQVQILVPS